jgi:hypothetical protein
MQSLAHSVPASRAPAIHPPGSRARPTLFQRLRHNVEMGTVLSPVQTNIRLEPDGQCRYVAISFPSQNIFARPTEALSHGFKKLAETEVRAIRSLSAGLSWLFSSASVSIGTKNSWA